MNNNYCYTDIPSLTLNDGGGTSISAGVAAGIAGIITLLVTLPVGVILGCCSMWYMRRHGQGSSNEHLQQKIEQLKEDIYDEPLQIAIPLNDNQAYGHIDVKRSE